MSGICFCSVAIIIINKKPIKTYKVARGKTYKVARGKTYFVTESNLTLYQEVHNREEVSNFLSK